MERVYFVEDLCQEDLEDMREKMKLENLVGNKVVIVEKLEDVPEGAFFYNGIFFLRKQ